MPGSDLCIANLKILQKSFNKKGQETTIKFSNKVLGEAQAITPVKTGKLRRSGNVSIEKNTLTEFYCRIGFPVSYAAKVHEKPIPHRVGQSQFLRIPFVKNQSLFISMLESELKGVV